MFVDVRWLVGWFVRSCDARRDYSKNIRVGFHDIWHACVPNSD